MAWAQEWINLCSVNGCGKPAYAKGWCRPHWHRMHKYGRLEKIVGLIKGNCIVEGCDDKIKGLGFCKRHYTNFKKYGVHPNDYNEKLKAQNFVCAICEEPETSEHYITKEAKKLSQDHCHKTGKMRDLLCTRCNHFLGRVNESVELLQKMINYLKKHGE